jgi:hypothetical protein
MLPGGLSATSRLCDLGLIRIRSHSLQNLDLDKILRARARLYPLAIPIRLAWSHTRALRKPSARVTQPRGGGGRKVVIPSVFHLRLQSLTEAQLLGCVVEGFRKGQMKSQRKFRRNWDDASFIMRTDVERQKKPRLESEPLDIPTRKRFDFKAARKAWAAIDMIVSEKRVRDHMKMLSDWEGRGTRGKALIRIKAKKFKLDREA